MASSTVRPEPRAQTFTPERIAQFEAAIATLQATGAPVTAEGVWRITGGRRGNVQVYVKAWRTQQQAGADVPVDPVAPASPPTPPVSRLQALRAQVGQLDEDWRALERTQHQLQQQRAQAHANLRNGLLAAARLAPQVRQADAQALRPESLMQADAAPRRAQLYAQLAALVGEAEVARVRSDPRYRPWWLAG